VTVETRTYDRPDGEPVAIFVVTGLQDVARLVGLLASNDHHHSPASRKLRQQVRRHNGGQAALRLLAQHGGGDFSGGWLTDDEIAPLSIDERAGLPVQHHLPVYVVGEQSWRCRVCWNATWPCWPALMGGQQLAKHFGLPVVP
jgi:hypothetical protein